MQRNRIVIESQTGKFDVTQQMATFIAWQSLYYNAYYYYMYLSYGLIQDTNNIVDSFSSADQYAIAAAQAGIQNSLRDSIDETLKTLKSYVAVCDEAYRAGVTLDDSDMKEVNATIDELNKMRTNFGYGTLNAFLKAAIDTGVKKSDVKDALEMVSLYNKYCMQIQESYEKAVTLSDLTVFRDENPEDYYKIDYLVYTADDEDFAKELAACTNAEQFKDMITKHHFDENYKGIYNKYTVSKIATDALATISGKTNNNNGTALSDALTAIDSTISVGNYSNSDETLNEDLKKWLFDSKRKQYETTALTSGDDGIYLIAFLSATANSETVQAWIKYYTFEEGSSHEGNDTFKDSVFNYLLATMKGSDSLPEVAYKSAATKADDLKTKLTAEGANITDILMTNNGVRKDNITKTSAASVLPETVRDAAFATEAKQGDVWVKVDKSDDSINYVIYIESKADTTATVQYVTYENDVFFDVVYDLEDSLEDVYPIDETENYAPDAEAGTYQAWLSEVAEGTLTSVRSEFQTNYFAKTTTVNNEDTTTYDVYMIINTPMYLEMDLVVNGGYLQFSDADYAAKAAEALATLSGKSGYDLSDALSALSSSAKVSTEITKDSITDENLKNWLFDDARTENNTAVVNATDGKSAYVAIFFEKSETWVNSAKTNYVEDQMTSWIDGLASKYTPNEKVLDKFGEPTTTVETDAEEESTTVA